MGEMADLHLDQIGEAWDGFGYSCPYEGHTWRKGGTCVECGERLRCGCGCFARAEQAWWDAHFKVCSTTRSPNA